jgi:hypothetical protein
MNIFVRHQCGLLFTENGQGLIETLAVAGAVMALCSALGAVMYFGAVNAGMHYLLHESLVCQQSEGHGDCRKEFKARAAPWLFAAKLQSFDLSENFGHGRARVQLQMPLRKTLVIRKEMAL